MGVRTALRLTTEPTSELTAGPTLGPTLGSAGTSPRHQASATAAAPLPQEDAGPYRFERRLHDRWAIEGVGVAIGLDGDEFGRRYALRLTDCSEAGLGALCDQVMTPGTTVSIGFQMPGLSPKRAVVARCLPCGDGYRVALKFQTRIAA